MDKTFDIIVIGLGAMGSSTVYQLAKNNKKVLGIDRFKPPHTLGSSHGGSRIIREAYFEHPLYVPIVQRAYDLWFELEKISGTKLFLQTSGLMIGRPDSELVKGSKNSAELHHLEYKVLDNDELRARYPAFNFAAEMNAVWEPRAGVLFPEKCVATNLSLAEKWGATLHYGEKVITWSADEKGVNVVTDKDSYMAKKLVLTVGSWLTGLVPELNLPLQVERQVLFWFEPDKKTDEFKPQNFPVYICETERNETFYGFPDLGDGVKIAHHYRGGSTTPETIDRKVNEEEIKEIKTIINQCLPRAGGKLISTAVCMYTNTPDFHFLIDFHPSFDNVLIASPCSGHGFKFSSAIGEIISDLLITGSTRFDLDLFNIKRLLKQK